MVERPGSGLQSTSPAGDADDIFKAKARACLGSEYIMGLSFNWPPDDSRFCIFSRAGVIKGLFVLPWSASEDQKRFPHFRLHFTSCICRQQSHIAGASVAKRAGESLESLPDLKNSMKVAYRK